MNNNDIVALRTKGNRTLNILLDTTFQIADAKERLKYLNRLKAQIEIAIDETKADLNKEETK
jgi:hypothetical protein